MVFIVMGAKKFPAFPFSASKAIVAMSRKIQQDAYQRINKYGYYRKRDEGGDRYGDRTK